MRLNRILHPEIVLGKRGDASVHKCYKELLSCISRTAIGYKIASTGSPGTLTFHAPVLNHIVLDHMLLARKFFDERPKVYFIPKDWAEVMAGIDKEVPVDLLPERWFGYLAFGEDSLWDEDEQVMGAYVFIGPDHESSINPKDSTGKKVIWISYDCKERSFETRIPPDAPKEERDRIEKMIKKGMKPDILLYTTTGIPIRVPSGFPNFGRFLVELQPEKVSELLEGLPTIDYFSDKRTGVSYDVLEKRTAIFRAILNSVLYINSVGADIQVVPSHANLSQTQAKKLVQTGKAPAVNGCTLPVTLVSYNWKKPINFGVDSTFVQSHQRWQRCGPAYSQVKLVWVKAHTRHFKKDSEDGG